MCVHEVGHQNVCSQTGLGWAGLCDCSAVVLSLPLIGLGCISPLPGMQGKVTFTFSITMQLRRRSSFPISPLPLNSDHLLFCPLFSARFNRVLYFTYTIEFFWTWNLPEPSMHLFLKRDPILKGKKSQTCCKYTVGLLDLNTKCCFHAL